MSSIVAHDYTARTAPQAPHAIVYRSGCELFLPTADRAFARRLERQVPPRARAKLPGPIAAYLIVAPWHTAALALAGAHFPDFTYHETDEPYTPPDAARIRTLPQRARRANQGAA